MLEGNKSARNEQRKLTATYLNTIASAILALGGIAPLAAIVYGNLPISNGVWVLTLILAVCICISLALHFLARALLVRIEE